MYKNKNNSYHFICRPPLLAAAAALVVSSHEAPPSPAVVRRRPRRRRPRPFCPCRRRLPSSSLPAYYLSLPAVGGTDHCRYSPPSSPFPPFLPHPPLHNCAALSSFRPLSPSPLPTTATFLILPPPP